MPKSALPEHINDPEEIEAAFPDDSEYGELFKWLKKKTKAWLAFGPRATEWWAKWREWPLTLFKIGGKGYWRYENDIYDIYEFHKNDVDRLVANELFNDGKYYLSRIQYWKRWHFAIHWPFLITFHVYFKKDDVPYPYEEKDLDGKLFYCYFGAKRDADKVYWFPSAYIGLNWK